MDRIRCGRSKGYALGGSHELVIPGRLEWRDYLGHFRYTAQNVAGEKKSWANVFDWCVSEALSGSKAFHTSMTAVELFDDHTGDAPTKCCIHECRREATGAASGQKWAIACNESQL